jgi:AcrR family transcriptional regulator
MARPVSNLRSRLLSEARAMLREEGLRQFNLRALASRADITAGSMYYHFQSKADLLGILAAAGFSELSRQLERKMGEVPLDRRLRIWARQYFRFAESEPALFDLMYDPAIAVLPAVAEARAELRRRLGLVVREMSTAYGRGTGQQDEIATAVWAAAHGGAALAASCSGRSTLIDEVIAGLEAIFLRDAGSAA